MTINSASMTSETRVRALFPDASLRSYIFMGATRSYLTGVSDYDPIIQSFGDVLVQVDDNDYSGDTRALLRKDGRYGFLNFGWGSCSGCDGLQACSSYEDVEDLITSLKGDIKWFDTLAQAQAYIANDEERQGSYYYHQEEWEKFKTAVAEVV